MQLIRKITITLETPALEISLAFISMNSYWWQALGGEDGGKPKIPLHSWNINVNFSSYLFFFCKWFSCYWWRLPPNKKQNLLACVVVCNTPIKQMYASTTGTGHPFSHDTYGTGGSIHRLNLKSSKDPVFRLLITWGRQNRHSSALHPLYPRILRTNTKDWSH